MLKHEIRQCVMGSFVLHALIFILFVRAASVTKTHKNVMEAFIITPAAVSVRSTGQPMIPVAKTRTEHPGPETGRSVSRQKSTVTVSKPVYDTHPDRSLKSETPVFVQAPVAAVPAETGIVMNTAQGSLDASDFPGERTEGQSSAAFPHGTETRGEMSLGDEGAPRFIHKELPRYPFLARKLGKDGKVVLRLTLDEKGAQKEIEVIEKAGFGFTEAAVQAIKNSILSPAQKDGKPIVSRVLIPIKFVLRDN